MPLGLLHLKYLTRWALHAARRILSRDRNFDPFAWVVEDSGEFHGAPVPGEMMLDPPRRRRAAFERLAEFCREHGLPGLIIVTDGWAARPAREQEKRLIEDAAYRAEFERIANEQGLAAAAAAGFGALTETISCQGQTRDFALSLSQPYQRIARYGVIPPTAMVGATEDIIPPHRIRFIGKPQARSTECGWRPSGQMFQLY